MLYKINAAEIESSTRMEIRTPADFDLIAFCIFKGI